MLCRFIFKPSNLKSAALICTRSFKPVSLELLNFDIKLKFFPRIPHFYSTNGHNSNGEDPPSSASHSWTFSSEIDNASGSIFEEDSSISDGFQDPDQMKPGPKPRVRSSWIDHSLDTGFDGTEKGGGENTDEWPTAAGFKSWNLEVEDKKEAETVFDVVEGEGDGGLMLQGLSDTEKTEKSHEQKQLEVEEKALTAVLKGPDRAFGDLIAESGITDEMLDSLIALKDFGGVRGLPPLAEIEQERYENSLRKSPRAEIELQKQEEVAKARVRQIDEKGRAYGTGRRKCSIARVWIQPGDGKFVVNDKEFDVYFPMLDHRATLLRPFSETMTLGKWDVNSTVKGGGVSGQVGAIRLGVSRALQNWAPDFRPPLRKAGFLTRDSRVVERKKPGKAKARKSFQWVKR